jgi:3-phenylpropionate/cinnamic acid dioxygenase small subunit
VSRPSEITPELQHAIEQWYYREARLLDGRQYRTWLGLCSEAIQYVMPARTNPLVDNEAKGQEEMLGVERELEGQDSDGCPIRNETYPYLALRVERSFKPNAWAENPPARTRRIVGNVELTASEGERVSVVSNFLLFYSRPGSQNFLYAGQRRDILLHGDASFKLLRREIVMDLANIDVPTLGLFL